SVGEQLTADGTAAELHSALPQGRTGARQERVRHVAVDQQTFGRVAHSGPLTLGVEQDALGHLQVGAPVHVDVAIAHVVLQHRHACLGRHSPNQALPAAGNDKVDVVVQLEQVADGGAVGGGHELDGVTR